jgi:hypothetical protein
MPSSVPSHTSAQNTALVESEAELEYEAEPEYHHTDHTDPESDPDEGYVIENQLGLPDYQYGIYVSSPPRADADVNCDKLDEEGEFFSRRKACKAEFSVSRSTPQS